METKGEINLLYLHFGSNSSVEGTFGANRLAKDIDDSASPSFKVALIEELFRLDPTLKEETKQVTVDVITTSLSNLIVPEIEKAAREFARHFLKAGGVE